MVEPSMSFGWGATLILIGLVLIVVAAFWVWWIWPNRGRHSAASPSEADMHESQERLDLLQAARQWGDVSTTDPSYLRRRNR